MLQNDFFIEVKQAEYIQDYTIKVYFTNNCIKKINLKNHLNGEIFQPLKNIDFFKKFTIPLNTIEWSNGADFAPEFLYEIGQEISEQ